MSRTESPAMVEPVDPVNEAPVAGGLVEGMRLDQPTFHALYEAMPPGIRAELINGVVYIPSPLGYDHGDPHASAMFWLTHYSVKTRGVKASVDATAILGRRSEPQPDALLRILPEYGGQVRHEQGYIVGGPELVLEVARSTRYMDLGPKLDDYGRAGILEYVVLASKPDEIIWFGRQGDMLVPREPGDDGFHHSVAFPGLWLDPVALIREDDARILEVLELGLATPEHAAFVARLAAAKV